MLTAGYKQSVTYWAPSTRDSFGGLSFVTPTTFKGRWEEHSEMVVGPQGDDVLSKAKVFVPSVVEEGGYLYLGTSVTADPTTLREAYKILAYEEVPDLRNLRAERRAYL